MSVTIREIRRDDDFEQIRDLMMEQRKTTAMPAMNAPSIPGVQEWFFPKTESQTPYRRGYVAEADSRILAYIGLDLRDRDGVVTYALRQTDSENLNLLSDLLEKCAQTVKERGGKTLSYFAFTEFGQLRNREIFNLEKLGFRTTDSYMRVSARLFLQEWEAPEDLKTDDISAEAVELDKIHGILMEDGNAHNALIFRHQFQKPEPGHVILTLRNARQEITALAYYKVKKVYLTQDRLSATAFNLHFRPQFELSRQEKRRFLQGALHSMKQLELHTANSLMSLKNVDTFTLMVREGFDEIHSNFFALTKTVGEER